MTTPDPRGAGTTPDPRGFGVGLARTTVLVAGAAILVIGSLLLFIVRFRSRGRARHVEGPQIRGNTRLELAWTGLPVVILAVIATFVFIKLPQIDDPSPAAAAPKAQLDVTVKGYRFYWQFEYPNGAIAIDELRLPVDRVVDLAITAAASEVQHSWWIPQLGGKLDSIPGQVNHMRVRVDAPGTFVGQCAEFCGVQHAAMLARVVAVPADEFDRWVGTTATSQRGKQSDLGAMSWKGACSKCHGPQAQGDIGPRLTGNPLLGDREGLETLIRDGRGEMPRIGPDWSDRQVDALQAYVSRKFGPEPGGAGGGG